MLLFGKILDRLENDKGIDSGNIKTAIFMFIKRIETIGMLVNPELVEKSLLSIKNTEYGNIEKAERALTSSLRAVVLDKQWERLNFRDQFKSMKGLIVRSAKQYAEEEIDKGSRKEK